MIFTSIEFFLFFLVVFFLYYFPFKENTKWQNILLLFSSYFFYAWANWKILFLLMASTLVFYSLGIAIAKVNKPNFKKGLTTLGVFFGVGVLIYFKYTNFFISSFIDLFDKFGIKTNLSTFKIILPLGISFYTFRLLSYLIDINREKYEPTKNIVVFSTYVAFFPSILSGPIDRPNTLIPQLESKRPFNYDLAIDGARQFLWGLFKKIVIANNCAIYTNLVFSSVQDQTSSALAIGAILYTFQMYTDFSGYSDMAIGIGKLLGFNLTKNFNYPLFAQNISDYWRRWHISLTSWLTDYVFMPLNVKWRNLGQMGMILAIVVNFIVCGFWHGDNWTFVVWGLYNGLLFIPLILSGAMFKKTKIETNKFGFPTLKVFSKMLLTFLLITVGLTIFRAENISQAFHFISRIPTKTILSFGSVPKKTILFTCLFFICFFLLVEWIQRDKDHGLQIKNMFKSSIVRSVIYIGLVFLIWWFGSTGEAFIYFKF